MASPADKDRAVAIYSFICTVKFSDVDPEEYLRFALARIAARVINRIGQLMPWVVADQLRANARKSCAPVKRAACGAYGWK